MASFVYPFLAIRGHRHVVWGAACVLQARISLAVRLFCTPCICVSNLMTVRPLRGLQAGIIEGSLTSFNQQIRACFLPHTGKQEDSTT